MKYLISLILVFGYFFTNAQTVYKATQEGDTTTYYYTNGDSTLVTGTTGSAGYGTLTVLIQQDTTADPVMTILQNSLSGPTPILVNESLGWWEIQSTGSFTVGKTHVANSCSYPTGEYNVLGNYPAQTFYDSTGAVTGSLIIIPGNANFIGIQILDASGNPSDLSPFITIDDVSGTYSLPEIRVHR
jgi:hypothetical protein